MFSLYNKSYSVRTTEERSYSEPSEAVYVQGTDKLNPIKRDKREKINKITWRERFLIFVMS